MSVSKAMWSCASTHVISALVHRLKMSPLAEQASVSAQGQAFVWIYVHVSTLVHTLVLG